MERQRLVQLETNELGRIFCSTAVIQIQG
ncbi:hypothetical protein V12B01_13640 [Vibrio splendidus 12B01]|nr:hypothetical protein V12B01_13640 [Vibrio splendidus 12B01]